MDTFFLGVHEPVWSTRTDVPLFLSRRRLVRRKGRHPRATCRWALDSGGFTELAQFGAWTVPPEQYVQEARRFQDEVGPMEWAAIQDWMCEPDPILRRTGKTVVQHQRLTIWSYLDLMDRAPDVPWVPVLQGWELADYLRHVEDYARAGVNLWTQKVVGVGTVCRRQSTEEGPAIVHALAALGLRLHGFGFKVTGLLKCHRALVSADSMAWSYHERKHNTGKANDLPTALAWRDAMLARLGG